MALELKHNPSQELLTLAKKYAEDYINAVEKDRSDANRLLASKKLFKKVNNAFEADLEHYQIDVEENFLKLLEQYNDLWNMIMSSVNLYFKKTYLRINSFKAIYLNKIAENKQNGTIVG